MTVISLPVCYQAFTAAAFYKLDIKTAILTIADFSFLTKKIKKAPKKSKNEEIHFFFQKCKCGTFSEMACRALKTGKDRFDFLGHFGPKKSQNWSKMSQNSPNCKLVTNWQVMHHYRNGMRSLKD